MNYLIFLTLLWTTLCQATIREIDNMERIFDYLHEVNASTLVIFDIDMVLVQPSDPAFQMANMQCFSPICKRIMQEIPAEKKPLFLSLMTIRSAPLLIDEHTPQFLQQIKKKEIPLMALTSNLTGEFSTIQNMETWRINSLRQLGIDFSLTAPFQETCVFDHLASYRGNYSTYLEGIFFVNGTAISKGEALLAFLEKSSFSPTKVFFIDDREDNLKSVEAALLQLDNSIEYVGLHFTGAQKYPSEIISEEEFESRWEKLASEARTLN